MTVEQNHQHQLASDWLIDPNSKVGSHERSFNQLADEVQTFIGTRPISNVFYPAAGSDGSMGFKLFTDAKQVIGLDNHPFHSSDELQINPDLEHLVSQANGWEYGNFVGVSRTVAESFFNKLFLRFPNARVLKVQIPKNHLEQGVSGIVDFDLGEGTEVRRYIHINVDNKDQEKLIDMVAKILNTGIDATIAKGSMDIFRPDSNDYNTIGRSILKSIVKQKGILIDGDYIFHNNIRFINSFEIQYRLKAVISIADIYPRIFNENPAWTDGDLVYNEMGLTFGYSLRTNIVVFE